MGMRVDPEVDAHYALGLERDHLTSWGRLEAARTRELLARLLPPAPAVVLDVGGAEGAYALPLASEGYTVHLFDPVAVHVEAARASSARQPWAPLASAELGDARDLRYEDGAADEGDLRDGVHRNPEIEGHPEWFTPAYFHTPDGLRDEVRAAGFANAEILALEGLGATADVNDALDDPTQRATVMRALERIEREPSLLGVSPHLMAIATKT